MRTTAIICELNPLHRGHMYLLDTVRKKADCIIAIMSGNFVQRGEPALLDKYARAEIAVKAGADLVVELPFPWCAASAEYFAAAGTAIAKKTGAKEIAFGVGRESTADLVRAADFFCDPFVMKKIVSASKSNPSDGIAIVREKCLKEMLGESHSDILRTPNDVLAIEYLRQIQMRGYALVPQMIPRLTSETDPQFCGATKIRTLLRRDGPKAVAQYLPEFVYSYIFDAMASGAYAFPDTLFDLAFQALRLDFSSQQISVADGDGGLLERIRTAAAKSTCADEMLSAAATKRYTNARIRRVLLYYLLQISSDALRQAPMVTTLLAANSIGRAHLASLRKSSKIEIVTKPADCRALPVESANQYQFTLYADRLYTLCRHTPVRADFFLTKHPYFI